jgi:hypothetical protein
MSCTDNTQCLAGHACVAGTCIALKGNGMPCSGGNECMSTFCADGVCCNNACTGTCQACTAAKKGGVGSDGTCGNIAQGLDPDNECGPFTCDGGGACVTNCAGKSSLCESGSYCDVSGSCIPKVSNGTACLTAAQCLSGFCADGFCCDTACLGTCQACSAFAKGGGSDGTCGNVPSGTACGGGKHCSASGMCQ